MVGTLTPEAKLDALRKLSELKHFQWRCDRSGCDGMPHLTTNPITTMPYRHARAAQLAPPGDWWAWFLMSGRGFGKTRSGAEYVKERMMAEPGHRVACIVPDFGDGRDICIEGESGLVGGPGMPGLFPPGVVKLWNRSIGELHLNNGAMLKIFGTDKAKDAEGLRGYQCHTAWFEELGTQQYGEVAWDMLTFALRLGDDPRVVITGTPRPTPLIRKLVKDDGIVVTSGTTYDNAHNLAPQMLARIKAQYEGTTLGQQELHGLLLDGAKGALWSIPMILRSNAVPDLVRVVIAVDPAGTSKKTSDLTGIVVVGIDADGVCWVLADKSGRYSPEEWRGVVTTAYDDYEADLVVAEVNFGADMVASTLRGGDRRLSFKPVHASRGKEMRATPVVGLYEQQRVKHAGVLADLEEMMTTWVPPGRFDEEGAPIPASKESPDRMDAMVWGVTELAGLSTARKARRTMSFEEG
jgi:phage terminase large subunit-like protein